MTSEITLSARELALSTLHVTEQQIAYGGQVTPHLKNISATMRRAGQPKVVKKFEGLTLTETQHAPPYGPGSDVFRSWPWYLQTSADPDAIKILEKYYSLPKFQRKLVPIEAFCHSAQISPLRALEIITATCVRLGAQASTLISAVNAPRIVQKTVDMALTDEGVEDRAMFHRSTGFLPAPKGSQTNIQVVQRNDNSSTNSPTVVIAPPPDATIRRMVNRFNDAKALPEPAETVESVDAELIEDSE